MIAEQACGDIESEKLGVRLYAVKPSGTVAMLQYGHSSSAPIMARRDSSSFTHACSCQGGLCRTCSPWPHASSATQTPSLS